MFSGADGVSRRVGRGPVEALQQCAAAGGAVGLSRNLWRWCFNPVGAGCKAAECVHRDVAAVRFKNELDLACEEAEITVTHGFGEQKLELLSQALLQRVLALFKGLLDLSKFDDGLEVCLAVSMIYQQALQHSPQHTWIWHFGVAGKYEPPDALPGPCVLRFAPYRQRPCDLDRYSFLGVIECRRAHFANLIPGQQQVFFKRRLGVKYVLAAPALLAARTPPVMGNDVLSAAPVRISGSHMRLTSAHLKLAIDPKAALAQAS